MVVGVVVERLGDFVGFGMVWKGVRLGWEPNWDGLCVCVCGGGNYVIHINYTHAVIKYNNGC